MFSTRLRFALIQVILISYGMEHNSQRLRKVVVEQDSPSEERIEDDISKIEDDPIEPKKCPICHDPMEENMEKFVTDCGHVYHRECIHTWLKSHRQCPMCRNRIKEVQSWMPLVVFLEAIRLWQAIFDYQYRRQADQVADLENQQNHLQNLFNVQPNQEHENQENHLQNLFNVQPNQEHENQENQLQNMGNVQPNEEHENQENQLQNMGNVQPNQVHNNQQNQLQNVGNVPPNRRRQPYYYTGLQDLQNYRNRNKRRCISGVCSAWLILETAIVCAYVYIPQWHYWFLGMQIYNGLILLLAWYLQCNKAKLPSTYTIPVVLLLISYIIFIVELIMRL